MAYENPVYETYNFGIHDFGNGGDALRIDNPGKKGRVWNVHVAATETFTADTTPAYVRVGSSGDADEFAELNLGTTATDTGLSARNQASALKAVNIEEDEDVYVAFVAPTGGTPAGQGYVSITIGWF